MATRYTSSRQAATTKAENHRHEDDGSVSVWRDDKAPKEAGRLTAETSADVCIVGAGIAGMSVAYELTQRGMSVIVLDDGPIGGGETGRTTAHLVSALDDRFHRLESLFGVEWSRLAGKSHLAAVDRAEEIVRKEKIDCDFERVDGYLFLPPDGDREELDKELQAAARAGMPVGKADRAPLPDFDTGPCIQFRMQGQFHPMRYLHGLANAVRSAGGKIFTGVHVTEAKGGSDAHIVTDGGVTVRARSVVIATNSPMNDRVAIHTKQAPYRTFVIALEIPDDYLPHILLWDTPDPYHYVRTGKHGGKTMLIVGGEDHKTGQANDAPLRFERLESWTRARFPKAGKALFRWSGQVMEPVDGLAFIGRNPMDEDNVYIVTGDSGNGMTHGIIAGMLIADLIAGKKNPWAEIYEPSRKTPKAVGDFLKENANVMKEYCDLVTGGDVSEAASIAKNSGAVIRKGIKKIALYRDDAGKLHGMSAVCPHLGCIVHWNSQEKSWDCPCHGSRFAKDGCVLNGPAPVGLAKIGEEELKDL